MKKKSIPKKGDYLIKLNEIEIANHRFRVVWDPTHGGGAFTTGKDDLILVGTINGEDHSFKVLCHELMEVVHCIMNQRYQRPDCEIDFLFSYDHRGFTTAIDLFAGALSKFLKE